MGGCLSSELEAALEQTLAGYPVRLAERFAAGQHLTVVHSRSHASNFLLPGDPTGQAVYLVNWQQWGLVLGHGM